MKDWEARKEIFELKDAVKRLRELLYKQDHVINALTEYLDVEIKHTEMIAVKRKINNE